MVTHKNTKTKAALSTVEIKCKMVFRLAKPVLFEAVYVLSTCNTDSVLPNAKLA